MNKRITFFIGLFFAGLTTMAQDTLVFQSPVSYSFIKNKINVIGNNETLEPFYTRLNELREGAHGVVSILHIGDSHVQADYLTGMTRALLQKEFGNAGLGLIFPGRVARTNESPAIHSTSTGTWESNRITYSQHGSSIGIGGNAIKTEKAGSVINIKAISASDAFNRMTLFFQKDFTSFNIMVKDSSNQLLAYAGSFTEEETNISKLILPYPVKQVQLETVQTLSSQVQFTLNGVSLENSRPGIRYNIIGVNGAKYKHYVASTELLNQTTTLSPDLIILSMGVNEAADHPNMDKLFGSQVNTLIAELRKRNPDAIILLTTPMDFYKKRTRRNPGVQIIKNKILESAAQNKLPYWDLHEIAGGNHAADKWKKEDLLQSDGIHYTRKGYELQGYLLYEAIIKGYNKHVLDRYSKTH